MTDPYDTAPPADAMAPQSGVTADVMGNPVTLPVAVSAEDITDGFHTMQELYDHRRALTAVIATIGAVNRDAWRSKEHHPDDSPIFDGYFIVGIELPEGPISYHYPLKHWDEFLAVPVVEHAPKWDGHTADDVVLRLAAFTADLSEAVVTLGDAIEFAKEVSDGDGARSEAADG